MNSDIDLTVITNIKLADGIGRQGIGLIDLLKENLKLNVVHAMAPQYSGVDEDVVKLCQQPFNGYGKISFWTFILGLNENILKLHQTVDSKIKIAYSMFESDRIPELWVRILNSFYDVVLVPDPYLIEVYYNSGVKIPIGVLPLGIMLENFIKQPLKIWQEGSPFVFGMSAAFWKRKNHLKLLEAFQLAFGDDERFQLKVHGRSGFYQKEVEQGFDKVKKTYLNIELISGNLTQEEYLQFMSSIDCYVYPSMGEGLSITPREALALGKQCIISDCGVHQTLIKQGIVFGVKANQKIPAEYEVFGNQKVGYCYDCQAKDLAQEMKNVYDQYLTWQTRERVLIGREMVKNYLWGELKKKYLQLFKPTNIILENNSEKKYLKIYENKLITNSQKLFNKFQNL